MKILVVDDSALMRNMLKALFEQTEDIQVAGEATNGAMAVELSARLRPDLVLMDINMPILNGLEATEKIMKQDPRPICIFSSEVDSDLTVAAMGLGAVDAIRKPDFDSINKSEFVDAFCSKLRNLAIAKVPSRNRFSGVAQKSPQRLCSAVAIGASTGGPAALRELLSALPADFSLGIVLVQHVEEKFDRSFASWLNSVCPLAVSLAVDGDRLRPGKVLVAPGGYHLVCHGENVYLDKGPKKMNQKPSVDVLFSSAASNYREALTAVLLTGMGSDGADGCVSVVRHGGHTVVQDEASSAIFGMPRAAIEKNAADVVLPLSEIAAYLLQIAGIKQGVSN